jgi:hypothetical protein
MRRAALALALASAFAACGGSSEPAGKYLTGTFSDSAISPCITTTPIASPGGEPACTVLEDLTGGGSTTASMIPSCVESPNAGLCWTLAMATEAGCSGVNFIITIGSKPPAPGTAFHYSCLLCSSTSPPPPGC